MLMGNTSRFSVGAEKTLTGCSDDVCKQFSVCLAGLCCIWLAMEQGRFLPLPLLWKAEECCICWLLQLPAFILQSSFPHTATTQHLCLGNPCAELLLGDRYNFCSQKRLALPHVSPDLLSSWARLPASLPSAPQTSHSWYLTTPMQENVLKAGPEPCFIQVTRTPADGHLAPNFQ